MRFCAVRSLVVVSCLLAAALNGNVRSASASTITVAVADYRDDYQTVSFPSNWKYMWNSAGAIGTSANYTNMVWNGSVYASIASPGLSDPAPANFLSMNATGGHPGLGASQGGSGGLSRYAIAAYTVTQPGDYSLGNSSWTIPSSSASNTNVRVYVNNSLKYTSSIAAGGGSTNLNGSLGTLLAGDVIYVAEGALTTSDFGSFAWDFTVFQSYQVPEPASLLLVSVLLPLLRRKRCLAHRENDPRNS